LCEAHQPVVDDGAGLQDRPGVAGRLIGPMDGMMRRRRAISAAVFVCAPPAAGRGWGRGGGVMRILTVIAVLLAVSAATVAAQEAPDAARQAQLDRAERYLELAQARA